MAKHKKERMGLTKLNYLILLVAALLLIVGYIIMGMNEITVSPILLAVVYVIIIPFALLYRPKAK
ncbi:MAG TPA: hypothetical protein PLX59_03955 [Candidatus Cloacimonadota bacterium]|nr:hypothetical protein [Candidatus Cloacimonadota bacterium]